MKKGLLIYTAEDYAKNEEFALRFKKKAPDYGLSIEIVLENSIKYGIKGGEYFFEVKGLNYKPDFAVNRSRNAFIAKVLESLGARVFNKSGVTETCNDKNKAYMLAAEAKIRCLDTYIYTREAALEGLKDIIYPAVLKQPFSHGGAKVFLCGCYTEAVKALENIEGRFVTAQSRLDAETVNDVRVFVMGNRVIGAVRRTAKEGIKANYSRGGGISLFDMDKSLEENVNRLLKTGYYDFAGFDFLQDGKGGWYFNEIEDAVGSRSLCILGGIDTSEEYVKHITKVLTNAD